jgi:hypothetical protein
MCPVRTNQKSRSFAGGFFRDGEDLFNHKDNCRDDGKDLFVHEDNGRRHGEDLFDDKDRSRKDKDYDRNDADYRQSDSDCSQSVSDGCICAGDYGCKACDWSLFDRDNNLPGQECSLVRANYGLGRIDHSEEGIIGVSAPVLTSKGVVGAILIMLPAFKVSKEKTRLYGKKCSEEAARLSALLH